VSVVTGMSEQPRISPLVSPVVVYEGIVSDVSGMPGRTPDVTLAVFCC
jgi:hypothetical protein